MASAIVRRNTHGFLKDGRRFQILDINELCLSDDGKVHSGMLTVQIEGITERYPLSVIAESINYITLGE